MFIFNYVERSVKICAPLLRYDETSTYISCNVSDILYIAGHTCLGHVSFLSVLHCSALNEPLVWEGHHNLREKSQNYQQRAIKCKKVKMESVIISSVPAVSNTLDNDPITWVCTFRNKVLNWSFNDWVMKQPWWGVDKSELKQDWNTAKMQPWFL